MKAEKERRDSTNPPATTFSDIQNLLDTLIDRQPDHLSTHGAFWEGKTRDQFVDMTVPNIGLPVLIVGDPDHSNLYNALAGLAPFDNTGFRQMPDTAMDSFARLATPDELKTVYNWIKNGCP